MSTGTSDDLPDYVVAGEWRDEEWEALAGKLTTALTGAELRRVIAGPRRHPYPDDVIYQTVRDGKVLVWRDAKTATRAAEAEFGV